MNAVILKKIGGAFPDSLNERSPNMADISESVCLNHPDTPAVTRCATCGKPICERCIVPRNGSNYCSETCADNAANSVGRVNDVLENKKKVEARVKKRTLIIIVILLAAAAGGYYYYTQNKDDVTRFVKKTERKVKKNVKETKKSIERSLPSSSTYKRDRENMVK